VLVTRSRHVPPRGHGQYDPQETDVQRLFRESSNFGLFFFPVALVISDPSFFYRAAGPLGAADGGGRSGAGYFSRRRDGSEAGR
jgi:hypothetical protein